jgi:hypothetical protein
MQYPTKETLDGFRNTVTYKCLAGAGYSSILFVALWTGPYLHWTMGVFGAIEHCSGGRPLTITSTKGAECGWGWERGRGLPP